MRYKVGEVTALLNLQRLKFSGKDPVLKPPKPSKQRPQHGTGGQLVRGKHGNPQVKGTTNKIGTQKAITYPSKNVKYGGMRENSLVHNGK